MLKHSLHAAGTVVSHWAPLSCDGANERLGRGAQVSSDTTAALGQAVTVLMPRPRVARLQFVPQKSLLPGSVCKDRHKWELELPMNDPAS